MYVIHHTCVVVPLFLKVFMSEALVDREPSKLFTASLQY